MTDKSPRLKAALKYMAYGREGQFDAEKAIDLLQALEKITAVRDDGDGSAFKVDGVRGSMLSEEFIFLIRLRWNETIFIVYLLLFFTTLYHDTYTMFLFYLRAFVWNRASVSLNLIALLCMMYT